MFTNTNMNWNGCRSHVKVSKNEESIPEYLEFDNQGEGAGIRNEFHHNEFRFILIFIPSQHAMRLFNKGVLNFVFLYGFNLEKPSAYVA